MVLEVMVLEVMVLEVKDGRLVAPTSQEGAMR
jgi:hypothetical protein